MSGRGYSSVGENYRQDTTPRAEIYVERLRNLTGSTAGAGSGEFHKYSIYKRRERARVAQMEAEAQEREVQQSFENLKKSREEELKLIQDKKKRKRDSKKLKKKQAKELQKIEEIAKKANKFQNDGTFLNSFQKQKVTSPQELEKDKKDTHS